MSIYKIGWISTLDKVKYGKDIYLLKNLSNNTGIAKVRYNGKTQGKIIVVIDANNKILQALGKYEEDTLIIALMYYYSIFRKSFKKIIIPNELIEYHNNSFIFSIDPEGCQDIDDALSINTIDDITEINVYIADITKYISIDDIQSRYITSFSTLYDFDGTIINHLWNNEINLNSSLFKNTIRNVIKFTFKYSNDKLISESHEFTSVLINDNLSYHNCLTNEYVNQLFNFTKTSCTKTMVEYWMIKVNSYVGSLDKPFIYRLCTKSLMIDYNIEDSEVKNVFVQRSCLKGFYSKDKGLHIPLNINNYLQITSPLRRIVDSINTYVLLNNFINDINIDIINESSKNTKKFHNEINYKKLDNFKNTVAYVYSKNKIYLKEYNMFIKYNNEFNIGQKLNIDILKKLDFMPSN
jgi:hypothetical protein